jgi:chromosome segregation ATPase
LVASLEEDKVKVQEKTQQITSELPGLELKVKDLAVKLEKVQKEFDHEDSRVLKLTEQLRKQRDLLDQPLQQASTQHKTSRLEIQALRQEIEGFVEKQQKLSGEKEHLQNQLLSC